MNTFNPSSLTLHSANFIILHYKDFLESGMLSLGAGSTVSDAFIFFTNFSYVTHCTYSTKYSQRFRLHPYSSFQWFCLFMFMFMWLYMGNFIFKNLITGVVVNNILQSLNEKRWAECEVCREKRAVK